LMKNGHKVEGGDKLGKTIVFAKNDRHAEFFVQVFNEMFPYLGGEFCQKITNKVNYSQDLIDRFSNSKKLPQIAVSVDMLDTGIDVPEVLNLVFFKKIRSKSKFWQMIGRGTRLCPNLFSPNRHKENFYIFDFCKNFTYFETNEKELEAKIEESLTQKIFNNRVEISNFLQELKYQEVEGYKNLWNDLITILSEDINNIDTVSAFARKEYRYIEKYRDIEEIKLLDAKKISELKNHLSYVVSSQDSDESIKRFDLTILTLQLSILKNGNPKKNIVSGLARLGKGLEKLVTIPKVMEKKETIKLLNNDEFWDDTTILDLEKIRVELRDLIKYLNDDNNSQEIIYSDFSDEILNIEVKDIGFGKMDYLPAKEKLRKIMEENQDKLSIKKLRNNITLEETDIKELNDILFGDGIVTIEELKENYENDMNNSLGVFLRTIIGLDKEAVQKEFTKLIAGSGFTGVQLELIDYIVKHYVENGVFYKKQLGDKSIEDFYGANFFQVFPNMEDVHEILGVIEKINKTAKFELN